MKSIHIRDIDPKVLHHRSMQGELKTIITEAVRKIPELDLITVSTGNLKPWKRQDYYR